MNMFREHWIVGGIFVSLLWYAVSRQSFGKRQIGVAFWESMVGAFIALAVTGWSFALGEWAGVVGGVAALSIQVLLMGRIWKAQ